MSYILLSRFMSVSEWVKVARLCPTLCDPMDYTVHGILQARMLEWVTFPFSRGSSQPRDRPRSPTFQMDYFTAEPQGKPKNTGVGSLSLHQQIFWPRNWKGSLALQADSLPTELLGKPRLMWSVVYYSLFLQDLLRSWVWMFNWT